MDSAQDSDVASFQGDLIQSEKLSKIKPPLLDVHYPKRETLNIECACAFNEVYKCNQLNKIVPADRINALSRCQTWLVKYSEKDKIFKVNV